MASTGMKAADSGPASKAAPPDAGTSNNELCEHCSQALIINDQLAGGTLQVNASDGTTTLDLSGFKHNDWIELRRSGFRQQRSIFSDAKEMRDEHGWGNKSPVLSNQHRHIRQHLRFCAGNQLERRVTVPWMLEISASSFGPCRLCSRLRALFIEQYANSSWWNEHGSILRFTMQYEWSEYRSLYDGEDEPTIPPSQQSLDGLAVLVTCPGQAYNEVDVYQFDVVAWPGPCQKWLKIENTPPDPNWPTSDRNVGFMRQCIDECISNHPHCKKKTSKPTFIPTRLLDLGDFNAPSARLVECGQTLFLPHPEIRIEYATLSYCWGRSLTMTTTTANKSKHETIGIKVHNMPATFQDAIYVTRKLGIQYLWIDALCIVQDDEADWETEAVMMCDIFAHSKVTISAARSSSSAQPFLQRPIDEMLTVDFQSTLKPDVLGQYFIQLHPRHFEPAQQDIARSAWVSRAWVWQEDIMSTRQLVFGNKTLQFRCDHGILLEDGRYESNQFAPTLYLTTRMWDYGVSVYSSRALTHASDRLKAIAGAAKFIEGSESVDGNPPKYLAGLWQNQDFHAQLRWLCKEPSLLRTELMGLLQDRARYIAPSWSWASRNTDVDYPAGRYQTAIRIVESDLQTSHKDSMVSVAFGSSITLCGKLSQTPVEPSSGHLAPVLDADEWPFKSPYKWKAYSTYGRIDFWLDWVPEKDDYEESKFQRHLCLLLTSVKEVPGSKSMGLVLAPVLDTASQVLFYYRVGVFRNYDDSDMLMSQPDREITIR